MRKAFTTTGTAATMRTLPSERRRPQQLIEVAGKESSVFFALFFVVPVVPVVVNEVFAIQ
jgi:hypothetical protein